MSDSEDRSSYDEDEERRSSFEEDEEEDYGPSDRKGKGKETDKGKTFGTNVRVRVIAALSLGNS